MEVDAGCHPFVTKPSFVFYAKASRLRAELLVKCVEGWVYTPKERLEDGVFGRVCAGVITSPFTPRGEKKYFLENSG